MDFRILLVDDNRDTLTTYTKAIYRRLNAQTNKQNFTSIKTKFDFEIDEADSYDLAIKKLKTKPTQLLIVDLKIPGPSGEEYGGMELIAESMKPDPLLPIVVVSGYATYENLRKTLTNGVFDFIEKSSTALNDIMLAINSVIESLNTRLVRSGNPFTPMTGLDPTIFGGRKNELELFQQKIDRALNAKFNEHFLVLGDWGIGKSTLLKEYKKICQSQGFLASYVPIEGFKAETEINDVSRSLVEGILRDLPYSIDTLKKVIGFFDSLGISVLGTGLKISKDTSKKISSQAFLHDTLINLWHDLSKKSDILVILLDDVENLLAVPEFLLTLKATLSMDVFKDIKIIFGLSSESNSWIKLTSIKKHHPISRYFMSRIELSLLTKNEMEDTIISSLTGTGVSFNSEVIGRIYNITNGHPFEMQVLCYHLFNNHITGHVNIDILDKALEISIHSIGSAIFDNWLNQIDIVESKILGLISDHSEPISYDDLCEKIQQKDLSISSKRISNILKNLRILGFIDQNNSGSFLIPDKMFQGYINTYASI